MVRSSDDDREGSAHDLRRVAQGVERRRPGKTGEHDCAVLVGEPASAAAGRGFVPRLLQGWARRCRGEERLFGSLTLPRYAAALRWACAHLHLEALAVVPHSVRHGGASADATLGARSIGEVQARGLWRAASSVQRYRKPGLYTRQVKKLTAAQLAASQAALPRLSTLLR